MKGAECNNKSVGNKCPRFGVEKKLTNVRPARCQCHRLFSLIHLTTII